MKSSIKDISDTLLEKDIRPSHQRIKIMEFLLKNKVHPTVDYIYNELHEEIPTLSKTTVYNTLNLFVNANLVKTISIEGNEARYDIVTEDHAHFKCLKCNKIYDFPIDTGKIVSKELNNFKINEMNVFFKGICPKCSNDSKEN